MTDPARCNPSESFSPPLGLRPRDAARTLGVSLSTLERLTRSGEIACVKLPRAKIYSREELRRWLDVKTEASRVVVEARPLEQPY
jgi:excisionase family DNA binding protein